MDLPQRKWRNSTPLRKQIRPRFEKYKRLLSDLLKSKLETMRAMKKVVNNLESAEEEDYLASLVMPPMDVVEKIGRVDARLRRNFHKTFDTLMDVVYGKDR